MAVFKAIIIDLLLQICYDLYLVSSTRATFVAASITLQMSGCSYKNNFAASNDRFTATLFCSNNIQIIAATASECSKPLRLPCRRLCACCCISGFAPEPVWPSGKALGWLAEGPRFESTSALLSFPKLWSVNTVL